MGRYVEIVVFTIHISHKLSCFNEIGDGLRTEWKINVNEYTTSSIPAGMLIQYQYQYRVPADDGSLLPLVVQLAKNILILY